MPKLRTAVTVLLLLAVAGAAWFYWSSWDGAPLALPPAEEPADTGAAGDSSEIAGGTKAANVDKVGDSERVAAVITDAALAAKKGTLRVTALWPEGEPAADVMILLRRSVQRLPYAAFVRGITDQDGVIVFADVASGPSSLASDRGDRKKITVEAGDQQVTFELKGGIAVRGSVVNPDGARVAGASVWLQSRDTTWTGGRVATFTDAAGEFTLQHINPEQSLGAIAENFAPSKLVDLDVIDKSRPPAIVELKLLPNGGRLEGTVTDQNGEAVAKAVIAVGKNPNHLDFEGERLIEHWTVRTAETDEEGFFAIDGLATGKQPVAIRADGFGLWRGEATIERHGTTVIAPHLQPAATISGTVTDGDGNPLAEASVRVYDRLPGTHFMAGGQIDFKETFSYRADITGPDGTYRVEGVTPGTAYVFAQRHRDSRKERGVSVAYKRTEIEVVPGSDTTWDPVITDGFTIEGIVLFADGFPIPGLFITLVNEKPDDKEHVINSNREGVFRFLCLEDSTYEIRVQPPFSAPKGSPPIKSKSGVIPGRGRTELHATYDKPVKKKPGIVVGRIDDAGSRIQNLNAVTITLHSDDSWFRPGNKVENGAFHIDSVKPCRFRLTLKEEETVLAESDWFELLPASTTDTGVLVTEPGGSVLITVARDEGAEAFEPKLYLRRADRGSSTTIPLGRQNEVHAKNLTPGVYAISGYFKGMVSVKGEVQVVASQATPVNLSLRTGAPLRCQVWWPEGEVKTTTREYRILDSDGNVFHEYDGKLSTRRTRPYKLNYTLPLGHWKLEFSTDDGLSGHVEFDVKNTTDEVQPRIDLR